MNFKNEIFDIRDVKTFENLAIELFQHQTANNPVYHEYLKTLKVDTKTIKTLFQIPFLPIGFFKTHKVICGKGEPLQNNLTPPPRDEVDLAGGGTVFISSGTTGSAQSKHYVPNLALYEESFRKGFEYFYGNIRDYCILALLPSYAKSSSLVYMMNDLIKQSEHPDSGFYIDNIEELAEKLIILEKKKQKVLFIGVSFALLGFADSGYASSLQNFGGLIVMETGGMSAKGGSLPPGRRGAPSGKGRRKEMVREELHKMLCDKLEINKIHSEYGMTELLSQAYSKGNGRFNSPPWMKVIIRDINDPLTLAGNNKTGGINIIDLANINSCAFIATQDLGKVYNDDSFEVLGRFDSSDIRGCNLLVDVL